MYKIRFFLVLTLLHTPIILQADDDVVELDGAEGEVYVVSCPSNINVKLPTYKEVQEKFGVAELPSKESDFHPTSAGSDGHIKDMNVSLSLIKAGEKKPESGSCYYRIDSESASYFVKEGARSEIIQKKIEGGDKPLLGAQAYRRADRNGVQVIGMKVPLKSGFVLDFNEVPFSAVFDAKDKILSGTKYLRAYAKVSNNDRGTMFGFGDAAFIVSLTY